MNQRVKNALDEVQLVIKQIPEVIHAGDPILRQPCEEVTVAEGKLIGENLIKVLKRYEDLTNVGGAMAAPQIGISKRVFVLNDRKNKTFKTFINPKVVIS